MIDPWARSKYKKWWTNWFQFINTPFLALLMDVSSLLGYIYGKCKKLKKAKYLIYTLNLICLFFYIHTLLQLDFS